MTDVTVERMNSFNILGVKEISDLSFSSPWSLLSMEKELINKNAVYIVVKLGSKVVAFGGMWIIFDEGHITNIAVHPDYRRNNFGDVVVENLISIAKNMNMASLTLEVRSSNIAAINLYKKHHFSVEGIRKNYYQSPKEDGYIMWNHNI
ncbi:ribosomal protein S18-alanine N-acetyltransferase [Clostridium subterminale]|uniref:[Ribosomal protein bS18]-alanine N-acetyltransferase n=1 Tax=Clostridium subterminale TaxID=1550 RepID=A0ABN1KLV0_CLOSU